MQKERPKIGLALGCGGTRGYAHIGVIKVLERNKIPIDFIVGSSVGAVIGSHYALFKGEVKDMILEGEKSVELVLPRIKELIG